MVNIKAVIFDLDNTLVDRKKAFHHYCLSFIDDHFSNQDLPDTKDNMIQYMTLLDNDGLCNRHDVFGLIINKWDIKGYDAQQLCDNFNDTFYKFTTPDVDMHMILNYLIPKYKLGIITNGSSKSQNGKIDHIGIREMFDSVIVSDDVGVHKPDERIFNISCSALGIKHDQAVYVGDNHEKDIVGAKNAGLYAIWYTDDSSELYSYDCKIKRLSEIMSIL